jgi:DNA-binding CsgD family transcriptional regulator
MEKGELPDLKLWWDHAQQIKNDPPIEDSRVEDPMDEFENFNDLSDTAVKHYISGATCLLPPLDGCRGRFHKDLFIKLTVEQFVTRLIGPRNLEEYLEHISTSDDWPADLDKRFVYLLTVLESDEIVSALNRIEVPNSDKARFCEFLEHNELYGTTFTSLKAGLAINPADVAAILIPTEDTTTDTKAVSGKSVPNPTKKRKKSRSRQPRPLTPKQKQVYDMIHKDRMSQGEVADILRSTIQNVSNLLKKAEAKMSLTGSRSVNTEARLSTDSRRQETASTRDKKKDDDDE